MEKTLLEDGPEGRRLTVKLTEFNGIHLLDIRYWYFDKKAGEYRSTRKGVSLTGPKYRSIIATLVDQNGIRVDQKMRIWST